MSAPLIIGLPSKGRLKEQVEAWLSDCGFEVGSGGGGRGYTAGVGSLPGAQVQFLSAAAIASALEAGDIHLGVTGEDLMRELGETIERRVMMLRPLGLGRADVVVAVPQSWLDVETMADLEEVAQAFLARTGGRIRVATKYAALTRAFFSRLGIADYRIVLSEGATEGVPAAGAAELIVDITTTGATLAANHLKVLQDGVILKSQAQLAAALRAKWTAHQMAVARRLLSVVEARARARCLATLAWPAEQDKVAQSSTERYLARGASRRANGLLLENKDLIDASQSLAAAGVGPVTALRPEYVFDPQCAGADNLVAALEREI
ncbi:MAG TPA: ATP phosphoribosyltransferase [Caulobacteraceae bacterium]|nr:ATP phosphoribosyltransferase [Caulobacteraceae bacterium]